MDILCALSAILFLTGTSLVVFCRFSGRTHPLKMVSSSSQGDSLETGGKEDTPEICLKRERERERDLERGRDEKENDGER